MNGQRARPNMALQLNTALQLKTALGRIAACLLAVATVTATALMLAPVATANPEAEANVAITAAYDASGGPAGPLGPPDGGVYPVGAGFGQNYAGGKMFFTPATGAHFMQGAILAKYESLGGPADSDLGFPTMSEGRGRVGPDSRNVTFSASDRPVIFWTPETGARVVRGAINLAWDELGGSSGVLGVPAEDEVFRGGVVTQRFTGGELSWERGTGEFTTVPPELVEQLADLEIPEDPTAEINAARRAAGGALGPLGAKDGDEYPIGADGIGQDFAGGTIFYSPATGANVLTGQLLEKYQSVGGPEGDLGFPASNEQDGGLGSNSRMATFAAEDEPVIFWTPDYGAVIVRGAMRTAWDELGAATGELGAPVSDQAENGDEITQRFSAGSITWDRSSNRFTTEPANLASQLSGLDVPGEDAPAAAEGTPAAQADGGDAGVSWQWWWLLVLIPVLALVAVLAGLTVWNRRRRRDDGAFDEFDAQSGDGPYDGVAVPAGRQPTPDDDDDTTRFADHYGEPATPGYSFGGLAPHAEPSVWGNRGDSPAVSTQSEDEMADATTAFQSQPETSPDDTISDDSFFDEDQDDVDTSPTLFPTNALNPDPETSGRHAAIDVDEQPVPGQTGIHLPRGDDPRQMPDGYPIKASVASGQYWLPDSQDYDDVDAEIWFVSEELARTNGFVEAD